MKNLRFAQLVLILCIAVSSFGLPAFAHASYTMSEVAVEGSGGTSCGLDTAGNSGTGVPPDYVVDNNPLTWYQPESMYFPTGFLDNPTHFCNWDSETYFCGPHGGGCDSSATQGWVQYPDTYIDPSADDPSGKTTCGGKPYANSSCQFKIKYSRDYYIIPPVATLSATSPVNPGSESTLTYSCANSTSGSISNGIGSITADGGTYNVATPPLSSNTNYTLSCTGPGGTDTSTASVTVASTGPGAFISANPTSISAGSASQLTYECTNSTSGSIDQGVGSITADGQYHTVSTGALSSSTTYTITCTGNGSVTAQASAAITVTPGTPPSGNNGNNPNNPSNPNNPNNPSNPNNPNTPNGPNPNAVSALLTADPLSVPYGLFSTLSWSSQNATSCTGTPVNFTGGETSGSLNVFPLVATLYTLTCQDNAGDKAYDSQNVTVTAPDVSISASPSLVTPGATSVISWSVQGNVNSCAVAGPNLSSSATSGSAPETINTQSTYTISCVSGSYNPTQSVTVNVVPNFKEF